MELSLHRGSLVAPGDSEALIANIVRATTDPRAGVFGPQSMSWKINREAALFLGAGRASLLQLAHPWVSAAMEQHSNVMSRPIARFHNTFRIVFAMIFGSLDQAVAATRHLYRVHTYVRGEMTENLGAYPRGSIYEANDIAALRWVYATLIETAVLAYECVMPPLAPAELTTYLEETRTLAAMFGIRRSELPRDWTGFLAYCREMEDSNLLGVTGSARAMAHDLLRGTNAWIKPPYWYRALTTEWLAPRLRREFELPFGDAEKYAVQRARRMLPRVFHLLPRAIRFVGPWHEAQARLRGKNAGLVVRASNRFWIGQSRLPFWDETKS